MPESANFSNIYKFYDLINTVLTLGFDKSWRSKAADNLTGTSVLDLGSGTGAAFAQLINYETTALDPDKKMLELNIFENKILGTAENLPFDDNSFDVIMCNHVLEHVQDDRKVMSEFFRVMNKGGWGIFQVPIDYNRKETFDDPSITDPKEREKHYWQDDHLRLYGLDYGKILSEAGFEVVEDAFVKELDPKLVERYALPKDEIIYFCKKPI